MKMKVYNLSGAQVGDIELSNKVFGVRVKPEVVHQVFVQQTNNQREPWADTKGKGEVRGGGKKPWAQKGTGRARHGSIRSIIWKGGGVAFGPKTDRNYKTKINKKTKREAILMCLSDKAKSEKILVVENFSFSSPKTKLFAEFLNASPLKSKRFLVLTPEKDVNVLRMTGNIKSVRTMRAADINVMELLKNDVLVTSKDGVKKIEDVFSK
jgi:large subunit ribosomal protein L4